MAGAHQRMTDEEKRSPRKRRTAPKPPADAPDPLAAHAALSPEEAEHHERDPLLRVAELADDDVAHAADTPPGIEAKHDPHIPPPPDEIQMHVTHQPDDYEPDLDDGEIVRQVEELFPVAWLAMLAAVCYIAIYFAIDQLPNVGTNPLPGPGWF